MKEQKPRNQELGVSSRPKHLIFGISFSATNFVCRLYGLFRLLRFSQG